jgi:hypothetical protein
VASRETADHELLNGVAVRVRLDATDAKDEVGAEDDAVLHLEFKLIME